MLIAGARVETARPSRYLAQICRHINDVYKADRDLNRAAGNQQSSHVARNGQGRAGPPVHVEWSETHGTVTSGEFKVTMLAKPGELTLSAEAADSATLRRIQDLLTGLLERFGRRDQLAVQWQPPRLHAVQPADSQAAATNPRELTLVVRAVRNITPIETAVGMEPTTCSL